MRSIYHATVATSLLPCSEGQWKNEAANALFENRGPIVLHEGCPAPNGFKVEDCEVMKGELRPRRKMVN